MFDHGIGELFFQIDKLMLTQSEQCSFKQNYDFLRRKNDNSAVVVSNPCTMDFQICRTSILVGLLQSLHSNIAEPLPIRVCSYLMLSVYLLMPMKPCSYLKYQMWCC